MRKHFLLFFAALLLPLAINAQELAYVYIIDNDGPVTNIRNAPRGKVVATLPTDKSFAVRLLAVKGEWWKIGDVADQYGDDEMEYVLRGSTTGYWIHRSLLQFTIAGDPTGAMHAKPSAKSRTIKVTGAEQAYHPIGVSGKWIKAVSTDGKVTGWIHRDRICYNPLTTCP